jgi:hypothetical protein
MVGWLPGCPWTCSLSDHSLTGTVTLSPASSQILYPALLSQQSRPTHTRCLTQALGPAERLCSLAQEQPGPGSGGPLCPVGGWALQEDLSHSTQGGRALSSKTSLGSSPRWMVGNESGLGSPGWCSVQPRGPHSNLTRSAECDDLERSRSCLAQPTPGALEAEDWAGAGAGERGPGRGSQAMPFMWGTEAQILVGSSKMGWAAGWGGGPEGYVGV